MWPLQLSQLLEFCNAELFLGTSCEREAIVQGLVTDSRHASKGLLYVPLKGERFDGVDFLPDVLAKQGTFALVPRSFPDLQRLTGCPGSALVVDDVLVAFRTIAQRMRGRPGNPTLLAIGGSNGKTTTKEMVLAFLGGRSPSLVATRKSENGFIGIPKTLTSLEMTSAVREIVLEVGIDDIGSMQQHVELVTPDLKALTSLSHEHLEGLGSFENVVAEEMTLMKGAGIGCWQMADSIIAEHASDLARAGDWFVWPLSMSESKQYETLCTDRQFGHAFWRSQDVGNLSHAIEIELSLPQNSRSYVFKTRFDIPLPGLHNAANAALAFTSSFALRMLSSGGVAHSEGMAKLVDSLVEAFRQFVPPEMRSNTERFQNGSVLLVDCYNSNPASLNASLEIVRREEFSGHSKILILGDMLDLGAESERLHRELILVLESMSDCQLYLYGDAMYPVYIELQKRQPQRGIRHFSTPSAAEEVVRAVVFKPGKTLVLVKGSRGMAMERLLPGIRTELAQQAPL